MAGVDPSASSPSSAQDGACDVFIGFNGASARERALELRARLGARSPSLRAFVDVADLPGHRPWGEAIANAIRRASLCVFLVPFASDTARYPEDEVARALARERKDGTPVLALWTDGPPIDPSRLPYGLAACPSRVWTSADDAAAWISTAIQRAPPPAPPRRRWPWLAGAVALCLAPAVIARMPPAAGPKRCAVDGRPIPSCAVVEEAGSLRLRMDFAGWADTGLENTAEGPLRRDGWMTFRAELDRRFSDAPGAGTRRGGGALRLTRTGWSTWKGEWSESDRSAAFELSSP